MHKNIVAAFFETANVRGEGPCFHYKHEGTWKTLSWTQVADLVLQYARGLVALGVTENTPVAILSSTRMEWTLMDLAVMAAGGICVPIYANLPQEHIEYIIRDSGSTIIAVENDALIEKIRDHETIKTIIQFEGGSYEETMTLRALVEQGHDCPPKRIYDSIGRLTPDRIASYVYTSGTTGVQKGVVLTHGNIVGELSAVMKHIDFKPHEVCLVCLPQAHVLGRLTEFYLLAKGCQSAFAESLDKLAENYREVRPHFVVGVPRMLEKAMERIEAMMAQQPRLKRTIFAWAKRVGFEVADRLERKQSVTGRLAIRYAIAKKLVFSKLLARMGGRLRCFVSGGAPLAIDVAKFFTAAGVTILEGYGLTETFAAITANGFDDFQFGTVGKPLDGVEIKLADDGEVVVRGPMVFKEYLHKPEATVEAFEDGWFKTGDIGEFSKEGFLRITDRKKDIIITAGGKNVAPQRIESIMTENPYISHLMVFGDRRKYLTALITLNYEAIATFAQEEGIMYAEQRELAENPRVRELIARVIEEKNRRLARFETIKRFAILPDEFSTETGEITPTLKIRRKHVIKKYHDILENLYRE